MEREDNYMVLSGDSSASAKNQKSIRYTWLRWIALSFACLIMIGSYMSYDFPQNLDSQLESSANNGMNLSKSQVNMLYTVYSFPNIILPVVGGYLIDAIGIRKGVFLFSFILIIGQAICTLSIMDSFNSYPLMVVGRVVFGLGGENLTVAQSTIVSQWFFGKELSFAMGLNISVSRLGSIMSSIFFPALYESSQGLFLPLLIGTVACAFSWGCGVGLNAMDKHADKQEGKEQVKLNDSDKIKFADIKALSAGFWLVCISCVLTYISIFPFMQNLQDYLIKQFNISEGSASNYLSIPYFISACLTPFVGLLVDRYGKRGQILIASSIIMIFAHISFLLIPQCGDINSSCQSYWFFMPLILMGIFYSIYAAVLWPCVPLVCEARVVGTAFGIINCIQNAGLAVGPLITAAIIEGTTRDHGFFYDQIFFITISAICISLNVTIYLIDKKNGGVLNRGYDEAQEALLAGEEAHDHEPHPRNPRKSLAAKRSFKF